MNEKTSKDKQNRGWDECDLCRGTGRIDDIYCESCKGSGWLNSEDPDI